MPRSHPPTLITLTRAAIRAHELASSGSRLLVAVSGGPDSIALLDVLARLRSRGGFGLFAHGIDHGLRPESGADLDVAEAFAHSLGVPFGRTSVLVEQGGNLEARAREARWQALHVAAGRVGADRIATGHHANDRAETVLLRILRGTGVRGLGVLPPRDGVRIRPSYRHDGRTSMPTSPAIASPMFTTPPMLIPGSCGTWSGETYSHPSKQSARGSSNIFAASPTTRRCYGRPPMAPIPQKCGERRATLLAWTMRATTRTRA